MIAAARGAKGARVPLEPQGILARIEPHKRSGTVFLTTPFARRLRRHFHEIGAGFWLRRGAPLTVWELETAG